MQSNDSNWGSTTNGMDGSNEERTVKVNVSPLQPQDFSCLSPSNKRNTSTVRFGRVEHVASSWRVSSAVSTFVVPCLHGASLCRAQRMVAMWPRRTATSKACLRTVRP